MCWIDDLLSFWFPPQRDSASIPDSGGADPLKFVSKKQAKAPPEIPEFYLRPELIPIKEPDDTPLLADAYLMAGGGG